MPLPTIDVLIPTLNAAGILAQCLRAIRAQDYPEDHVRIIVADGGSIDETRTVAERAGAHVLSNPLKTGEAGKAVALRAATAEFVALIDSDNLLPDVSWFQRMVSPLLEDPDIIGSEPIRFTYRREDGLITRYCALLGMNDPLCLFLGNYDRECVLTGLWTNLPIEEERRRGYRKVLLRSGVLPTIGANGTLLRRSVLEPFRDEPYLFDIDIIARLARKQPIAFAKVDIGIIHLYGGSDLRLFIRKQRRRVQDYFFYRALHVRSYPWQASSRAGILRFVLSCLTILPLLWQSWRGYRKVHDRAWWFHPVACVSTLVIYTSGVMRGVLRPTVAERSSWVQVAGSPAEGKGQALNDVSRVR